MVLHKTVCLSMDEVLIINIDAYSLVCNHEFMYAYENIHVYQ